MKMIDPKLIAQLAAKSAAEASLKTILADSTSPSARAAFGIQPKAETKTELPIRNIGSENGRPWSIPIPSTLPNISRWPGKSRDIGKPHQFPLAKPGDNKFVPLPHYPKPGDGPVPFPNPVRPLETHDIESDWYGPESRGAAKPTIKSLVDWRDKLYNTPDNEKRDALTRAIIEDWYEDDMRTPNTAWPKDASELNELTQLIQSQPRDSTNSGMLKQLSNKSNSEYMDEALASSLGVWDGYEYYDHSETMGLSEQGAAFKSICEGHNKVLSNGNYEVKDTGDGKLTTYGGLTIATKDKNGKWVPVNGFTQAHVNNWRNGISPKDWEPRHNDFIKNSLDEINTFARDNGLRFTQNQFDALVDFAYTNGFQVFKKQGDGKYIYDFMNIMLEPGFFDNPTKDQVYRFETAWGNQVSLSGFGRNSGMWSRRMSQLGVFFGEVDENGNYIRNEYGNNQDTKKAADAWLIERGLKPTVG